MPRIVSVRLTQIFKDDFRYFAVFSLLLTSCRVMFVNSFFGLVLFGFLIVFVVCLVGFRVLFGGAAGVLVFYSDGVRYLGEVYEYSRVSGVECVRVEDGLRWGRKRGFFALRVLVEDGLGVSRSIFYGKYKSLFAVERLMDRLCLDDWVAGVCGAGDCVTLSAADVSYDDGLWVSSALVVRRHSFKEDSGFSAGLGVFAGFKDAVVYRFVVVFMVVGVLLVVFGVVGVFVGGSSFSDVVVGVFFSVVGVGVLFLGSKALKVEELAEKNRELGGQLVVKDELIAAMDERIAVMDERIAVMDELIAVKDDRIAVMELAVRDAELAARDAELAARDAEIERLRCGQSRGVVSGGRFGKVLRSWFG